MPGKSIKFIRIFLLFDAIFLLIGEIFGFPNFYERLLKDGRCYVLKSIDGFCYIFIYFGGNLSVLRYPNVGDFTILF
jgi:hypothetical protein